MNVGRLDHQQLLIASVGRQVGVGNAAVKRVANVVLHRWFPQQPAEPTTG
jgi:hypothetical protein